MPSTFLWHTHTHTHNCIFTIDARTHPYTHKYISFSSAVFTSPSTADNCRAIHVRRAAIDRNSINRKFLWRLDEKIQQQRQPQNLHKQLYSDQ